MTSPISASAAGTGPAWNVHARELTELVAEIRGTHPELANHAAAMLEREVKVAPTLVKYAAANPYRQETRRELEQAARECGGFYEKGRTARTARDLVPSDSPEPARMTVCMRRDQPL